MTAGGVPLEVWFIDSRRSAHALQLIEVTTPRLSDDEVAPRAASCTDHDSWRAQRIALRILLERHTGERLRRTAFATSPAGKPSIPWRMDVEFSLSHAGAFGLIAIARDGPVGVDLEQARALRFSSPRRAALVAAAADLLPVGQCRDRIGDDICDDFMVLQAWVRLEAWAKARGTGIGALLSDLGIWGPKGERATGMAIGNSARQLAQRDGFQVANLDLPDGLQGAVCAVRLSPSVIVRNFPADQSLIAELACAPIC